MNAKERMLKFLEAINESANSLGRKLGGRNSQKIYHVLKERNKISEEMAEKIKSIYPWVSKEWLAHGFGEMHDTANTSQTYSQKLLTSPDSVEVITKYPMFQFNMKGDSMYPELQHGDTLCCNEIDKNDVIEYGKKFLIETKNGIMVRKLMPSEFTDTILLESTDEKKYPTIQVKLENILKIAIVTQYLRMI